MAVAHRGEGFDEARPNISGTRIEIPLGCDRGRNPLYAMPERVISVVNRCANRKKIARLGVKDEEQTVEQRQGRVVNSVKLAARVWRISRGLQLRSDARSERRNDVLVDAFAEAIAERDGELARPRRDLLGESVATQCLRGEQTGEVRWI